MNTKMSLTDWMIFGSATGFWIGVIWDWWRNQK